MSTNRIQKLLFSEYCDFEDMVLVESPFAETNREGKGLRQVHLGLTPSKLVLATDILPMANDSYILFIPGLDPDIETLELVAVYPIDCVNLSVFHRRKRQSLKARFCNNKVMYFELGGFEKRNMFWNLWCEKIKFLSPEENNFSHSETSVATSTSNSTLYLVSSKRYTNNGASQIWCQYAGGDFARFHHEPPKWPDKHLYMGKALDESPLEYTPLQMPPTKEEFVKKRIPEPEHKHRDQNGSSLDCASTQKTMQYWPINRFSCGVMENCNTGLYLPTEDFPARGFKEIKNPQPSNSTQNMDLLSTSNPSLDISCIQAKIHNQRLDFIEVANSAIRLWEMQKVESSTLSITAGRHRRRYAFAPQPHFYRGLGPWNVNQGERFTLQMKRAVSMVSIKRQPLEPELRLSVSRRQLVASISCENLYNDNKLINHNTNTLRNSHKSPVIFFWTPEYWYRPQSTKEAYQELQAHLNQIHKYHTVKDKLKKKLFRRRTNCVKLSSTSSLMESDNSISRNYFQKVQKDKRHSIMKRIQNTSRKASFSCIGKGDGHNKETSMQFLKRILRMEISLCAWDFDSDILATQLTLIDKDLFMKIMPEELSVLLWQQSSKNAPNIGAVIAFSHRISSLVATEILKDETEKIRARLITRFINIAEKCHNFNNFQSCRSVLCGLQSPPIYRLYSTWKYIRKRHSSRYQVFEELCRLYRDVRLPNYQNSFQHASKATAYLPFIGDIISKLLDIVPRKSKQPTGASNLSSELGIKVSVKQQNKSKNPEHKDIDSNSDQIHSVFKKLMSSLKLWHIDDKTSPKISTTEFMVKTKKKPHLDYNSVAHRFQLMYFYEDNRQERLKECIELLKKYQDAALNYNFAVNNLAKEYLLKARYKEDQDNFMQSFAVEVPLQYES